MIWIELILLLACIVIGARLGGIALGTVAGIGLLIFVFFFGLPPGGPPPGVLGMIIAVITALAAMQAAGGLDYLVSLAEGILKKRPQFITFIAPVVTYVLVMASGTTHVIYALLPVIAEVSRKGNVRPERPLSISVIAGFSGAMASPISPSTVAMLGFFAVNGLSLPRLLMIMIPATFTGVILGALSVAWRGKKLDEDPEYQKRLAAGLVKPATASSPEFEKTSLRNARGSMLLFLAGILAVVLIGIFPGLRPLYEVTNGSGITDSDQVSMGNAIMIVMIAVAGLIMILFKASPEATLKGTIMRSGLTAIISILGVSWLGSSFFEGNRNYVVAQISDLVQVYPIAFAAGMFLLSTLLFSQAATVSLLMPVGLALGIPVPMLIGFYPAAEGLFFLPTYGTVLAAVSFDQTGTTRIGKYLLNHSFMRPGLVTMISTLVIAVLLSKLLT